MSVTLYIFDMGGVVARNCDVFPDILSHLDLSKEEFLTFAGENLERLFTGTVSAAQFWARFSRSYGIEVKEELFGKFFHPTLDPEVIALIRQVKAGLRVVCGTNTFDPHYDYHSSQGHYGFFDAVYSSNKIGFAKPDSAFYRYILAQERIDPENAFFVDDAEVNVLSAERLGISTVLFRDCRSLRIQMKNHQRVSEASPP
jgi:putative hydrolase of the HAD superfamily